MSSSVDEQQAKEEFDPEKFLIEMVAQLPLYQTKNGSFHCSFSQDENEQIAIAFEPIDDNTQSTLSVFLDTVERMNIEGIKTNRSSSLSAENIHALERVIEKYIDEDPLNIGEQDIAEITSNFLTYKKDQLDEIKQQLTGTGHGQPVYTDTNLPRSLFALSRAVQNIAAFATATTLNQPNAPILLNGGLEVKDGKIHFTLFPIKDHPSITETANTILKNLGKLLVQAGVDKTTHIQLLEQQGEQHLQIVDTDPVGLLRTIVTYCQMHGLMDPEDQAQEPRKTQHRQLENLEPDHLYAVPVKSYISREDCFAAFLQTSQQPSFSGEMNEIINIVLSETNGNVLKESPLFNLH